ncbi:MAG: hypothetical protein WBQ73_00520 [Candidatus Babeliales bacterium]
MVKMNVIEKLLCLNSFLFICFIITCRSLYGDDYLYPIDFFENELGKEYALVMYHYETEGKQYKTKLLLWDPSTNQAFILLHSVFSPCRVHLLPNKKGFSFFDDGRFRIKWFKKKSTQVIDFYAYIYHIGDVHWLTSTLCLFSAQYCAYYALFVLTIQGDILPLLHYKDRDFLFPSISSSAAETVFLVERTTQTKKGAQGKNKINFLHTIVTVPIQQIDSYRLILDEDKKRTILSIPSDQGIIFLYMIDDQKGFFCTYRYSDVIEEHSGNRCTFLCYFFEAKEESHWESTYIFSFCLPTIFFDKRHLLYTLDFLTPMLPRYYDGTWYYISLDHNTIIEKEASLKLYSYKHNTHTTRLLATNESLFVPVRNNKNRLYYGGRCMREQERAKKTTEQLLITHTEDGTFLIDLPYVIDGEEKL